MRGKDKGREEERREGGWKGGREGRRKYGRERKSAGASVSEIGRARVRAR